MKLKLQGTIHCKFILQTAKLNNALFAGTATLLKDFPRF